MTLGLLTKTGDATAGNSTSLEIDEKRDEVQFLTIAMFVGTLLLSQLVLFWSRFRKQNKIPEAGLLLLMGLALGALIKMSDHETLVKSMETLSEFDVNVFFLLLLPPIIFDSGYTIPRNYFFDNFGLIVSLAVFATILSSVFVALFTWASTASRNVFQVSGTECLVFGALISATDPVTVIAVFNRIGVKPSLLVLVFGESVLNDAVALVLYRTMFLFDVNDGSSFNFDNFATAVWSFLWTLLGSMGIGILTGFASAMLFKTLLLSKPNMRAIESSLAICIPYMSYSLAAGLNLSGIVSILFTGITMASYTQPNLSDESSHFLGETYHVLAHVAETFVFIYLGMSAFTGDLDWSLPAINFGLVSLFACLLARAFAIIPICWIANKFRAPEDKVTTAEVFVLWYAGLRGGMAFALSASSVDELDRESSGKVFQVATIIIVFVTVFVFGGTIKSVTIRLNLQEKDKGSKTEIPSPLYSSQSRGKPSAPLGYESGVQEIELSSLDNMFPSGTSEVRRRDPTELDANVHFDSEVRNSVFARIDRAILSPLFIRTTFESNAQVRDSYRENQEHRASLSGENNNTQFGALTEEQSQSLSNI